MCVLCIKCGSYEDVKVVSDTPVMVEVRCGCCGRKYKIDKVSIGKKGFLPYVNTVRAKVLENRYVFVEARGELIPKMLLVVGEVVVRDGIAELVCVDEPFYAFDEKGKMVVTVRVLLQRKE